MTDRTHDLASITLLNLFIATQPIPPMSIATAITALGATFIGGLAPDLDHPTAGLWQRIPGGSIIGRIISPLLGSHRLISHSFLGMLIIAYLLKILLEALSSVVLVDMTIIWSTFMLGYLSHLAADSLTTEGVPWLFPIPWRLGFPPIASLRIKSGGLAEKSFVFPGLLILNAYLIFTYYSNYELLIKSLIK